MPTFDAGSSTYVFLASFGENIGFVPLPWNEVGHPNAQTWISRIGGDKLVFQPKIGIHANINIA